jgi:hypothetical protein
MPPSRAQRTLARGHRVLRGHYRSPAIYQGPASTPGGARPDPIAVQIVIDSEMSEHELADIGVEYRRQARALIIAIEVPTPQWQATITIADGAPFAGTWIIRRVRPLTGGDHEVLMGADEQVTLQQPSAGWSAPLS